MAVRVGINGFGRIGRNVARAILEPAGAGDCEALLHGRAPLADEALRVHTVFSCKLTQPAGDRLTATATQAAP